MQCIDDEAEGAAAAAAINTIEVIAGAFGAGLAGVIVNSAHGGAVMAARWLFVVFAALGVVGVVASYRAARGQDYATVAAGANVKSISRDGGRMC
jgi:hypothetical protein